MDRLNATSDTEEGPSAAGSGAALARVTEFEIDGVTVQGPSNGFGPLWRKRYWVRLPGVSATPAEIILQWRSQFGSFWPEGNHFFGPAGRLVPGDIALIDLDMPAGTRLESGVVVLAVRPETFTLITPDGHVFAGVITFSAFRSGGTLVAQIEIVFRSGDPIFEVGMRLFGHRRENRFWMEVLASLAKHFGVNGRPEMHAELLDRRMQWSQAKNVAHNAYLRNGFGRGVVPVVSRLRGFGTRTRTKREETADS